ncbi:glycosyltransferase family 2 protein [Prevotella sp.]|uniref:glycosyltransferase family 2 protein n=1 Tax=Prevotella sp. TaxID=59823 RepID=UPI001CB369D5|nr:glycosyltransferase family A protein [Prevotella sp.]MBF1639670.1 glycosyltransferase family 2 protein [Prevotella sp.]
MITVFTPTYNRASLLSRLYQSLCAQNFKDFEWIIVDDGSSDDTVSIVELLQSRPRNKDFSIRYYKKENGGKHTAINVGVKKAQGDLFFIADSDDVLPPNTLQIVAEVWEQTKYDNSIGGICGFDGDINDGSIIGTGFPKDVQLSDIELSNNINIGYIDATTRDVRFKLKVDGDMKEVFRTSVLREFPFPEIKEERFCPEVLVWNRIASKYKLRHINKIIYLVEYQQDGITSAITRSRMNSPIASTMTYAEMLDYDISLKWKIRSAINYWRFKYCITNKSLKAPKVKWYWKAFQIIGLIMHLKDSK